MLRGNTGGTSRGRFRSKDDRQNGSIRTPQARSRVLPDTSANNARKVIRRLTNGRIPFPLRP